MNEYNKEWDNHFEYLEELRKSGVTNMFGARPYLMENCDLDNEEAGKVLQFWIKNYSELSTKFKWVRE